MGGDHNRTICSRPAAGNYIGFWYIIQKLFESTRPIRIGRLSLLGSGFQVCPFESGDVHYWDISETNRSEIEVLFPILINSASSHFPA